jgi:hypothetical protein
VAGVSPVNLTPIQACFSRDFLIRSGVLADDQVTPLTAIGESAVHGPAAFTTTHWSMVLEAQGPTATALEALDKLCRIYWRPIYGFVRRQGVRPEADNLSQSDEGIR